VEDGSLGSGMRRETGAGGNAEQRVKNGIREKQNSNDWRILVGNINTFPRETTEKIK